MRIFYHILDLKKFLDKARENGESIGFVPTMGALHAGHMSLIAASKKDNNITVVSIFVNPTQFNDKSDYEKYPITTADDILLLEEVSCDILFLPAEKEIYPEGGENAPAYNFGHLEYILEGASRPGHFKGVGQVVARLLEIVAPHKLYLGQKDYQQCLVIEKLVKILGKEEEMEVIICPIIREADGLAMSSRNRRLTGPQRAIAGTIYQCLVSIETKQYTDSFAFVKKECFDLLTEKGFLPEYISLADVSDLTPVDEFDNNRALVALIAAKLKDIRLIDNILLVN